LAINKFKKQNKKHFNCLADDLEILNFTFLLLVYSTLHQSLFFVPYKEIFLLRVLPPSYLEIKMQDKVTT